MSAWSRRPNGPPSAPRKPLKVSWTAPERAFPEQQDLYQHLRTATPKASKDGVKRGDAAAALVSRGEETAGQLRWPFQSHATMGPGCAIADVHPDGVTTIWSGGQKPHSLQKGFAELLHVPLDKVRVIWVEDAGSYGRPGYDDAAADAVLLSQAVGKPVRVQWMRADMTPGAPKAPRSISIWPLDRRGRRRQRLPIHFARVLGQRNHYLPSRTRELSRQCSSPEFANTTGVTSSPQFGDASADLRFRNRSRRRPRDSDVLRFGLAAAHHSPARSRRTGHRFAVESFMDEIAAAAGADPIEFRLKHLDDPSAKAVLTAAAEKANWDRRPSPKPKSTRGDVVTGRGVGLQHAQRHLRRHHRRSGSEPRTGAVRVKRFVCAHDCGLIINPDGLRGVIAANLIQSMSRAMKEEVKFDRNNVTSVDWVSYPVARASDIPEQVDIVLINHPELPPGGAGEPSSRPTAGGHRQRHLRRHRRSRAPSAAHAGAHQSRARRRNRLSCCRRRRGMQC